MPIKKICLIGCVGLLFSCQLFASSSPPSISLARGFSGVSGMSGFSLGGQLYWNKLLQLGKNWQLTGYWDGEVSYWYADKTAGDSYTNLTTVSISPVLRIQRQFAYDNGIAPFIDLGWGAAWMNHKEFKKQKLGSHFNFLMSIGAGINFGAQMQYDVAYHYLNFNNAGLSKNNDGLYVNTISFTYHFAD